MKRIKYLVITSIFLLFAIQTTSCAQKTFEQCNTLFENKDYNEAESCFKSVVKANPNNYRARMFLAKSYAFNKKLEQSMNEYKKIIADAPDTPYEKAARSSLSFIGAAKLMLDAKTKSQKRTLEDVTRDTKSCKKGNNDIIMTCSLQCDGKLVIKKDNSKKLTYPDGEIIEESPNGVLKSKETNGTSTIEAAGFNFIEDKYRKNCKTDKEGTLYFERNNNQKEYHYKNGDVKVIMSSGQKLLYKKNGGMEIIKE